MRTVVRTIGREASWSPREGLHGDPTILHEAKQIGSIIVHPHDGEQPVNWDDPVTAPAALELAARRVGGPDDTTFFRELEDGETPPKVQTSESPAA